MKTSLKWLVVGMVALLIGACVPAMAQQPNWSVPKNLSFLGEGLRAVYVTNLVSLTNQAYPGLSGTNVAGTAYTNAAGVRVVTTGSVGTNIAMLGSVPFWGPQNGSSWPFQAQTNSLAASSWFSPVTLSVTYDSGSGANSGITFQFTPSWDGVNPDTTGANDWITGFTTTASASRATWSTNAPVWLWNGAKAIMLKRVTYADTDPSGHVILRAVKFNGFGSP